MSSLINSYEGKYDDEMRLWTVNFLYSVEYKLASRDLVDLVEDFIKK